MARLNITLPDELAATLQGLAAEKKIPSVSGFLRDAAVRKLAYLQDAATVDELFGPPSPDEQALIERLTDGDAQSDRNVA
ncbi:ribbon-helix-helix protein, CopG family [Actinomadura graeca]|uniref:Ribbon-helix-helix protein, CopG family n=1 Tax=Actinomadura graeca TaxID=2750812 RepID=A0ABX8QZX9_9ACTN|nr:ribbon-helix-helix domain-containing protein [Actinomadura graeca]QXJ23272.1 ribbon-helix-helix protein, CopG family [Actinomadura graeca]